MNDSAANFAIVDAELPGAERASRCLRIYVRVKGIVDGLISGTGRTQMPATIVDFVRRLTRPGKFLPSDYWLPVERRRLGFDAAGRLVYSMLIIKRE